MSEEVTFAELLKLADVLRPPLYYVLDDRVVTRGEAFWVEAGQYNEEFVVLHPDDFEAFKIGCRARRLVPANEMPLVLTPVFQRFDV